MRPDDQRESAPRQESAFQTGSATDTLQDSRPTQRERVRRMLNRGWVCGVEFIDPPDGDTPVLRYSAHIHRLRQEGWLIDRRECEHPHHHHSLSRMYQWQISGHVDDGQLPFASDGAS